jgi:hypothetical protein
MTSDARRAQISSRGHDTGTTVLLPQELERGLTEHQQRLKHRVGLGVELVQVQACGRSPAVSGRPGDADADQLKLAAGQSVAFAVQGSELQVPVGAGSARIEVAGIRAERLLVRRHVSLPGVGTTDSPYANLLSGESCETRFLGLGPKDLGFEVKQAATR